MAAKKLHLLVITPERSVLDEDADMVVIPAHDGEVGVLNLRAPLMCELGVGMLRFERDGRGTRMAIDGGFAQVLDNSVTVLTSDVVPAEDVSDAMASSAAEAALKVTGSDDAAVEARTRAVRKASVLRGLRGR
ncbi:MAG: ATP synthase epsilon chain [Phycisphaerae bacterium]|nr:ATP synthase epsilon chain [Phycisphaerae bacterium]